MQPTHLLTRSRLDQIGLWHNFDGVVLSGIHGGAEINFGKATLAQQTSQGVTMHSESFTVGAFAVFLNNRLFVRILIGTRIGVVVGPITV